MARLVPGYEDGCGGACAGSAVVAEEEGEGGCGKSAGKSLGGDMAGMDAQLRRNEEAEKKNLEVEITSQTLRNGGAKQNEPGVAKKKFYTPKKTIKQVMGQCRKCGYLSSQDVCKACVLLEGLNKARPKQAVELGAEVQEVSMNSVREELEKSSIGAA